jgi:Cu/Ag efflux protein CusF
MKHQTSKLIALLAMVVALTFAACTEETPKTEGTAADTAAVTPVETTTAGSEPQTYTDIDAVVTDIQVPSKMIMVQHEKIGEWMEPMNMPFPVADTAMLSQVKIGDSVLFTVAVKDNQGVITAITRK